MTSGLMMTIRTARSLRRRMAVEMHVKDIPSDWFVYPEPTLASVAAEILERMSGNCCSAYKIPESKSRYTISLIDPAGKEVFPEKEYA